MTKGKTCGDYVNSVLAKREALLDGYDEAIMLDTQGLVSEASGENIFVVRDGTLCTPTLHSVLGGLTRATVIEIARDKGIPVEERAITRDELYVADEVFLTGTAAEVTPIREIDHRRVGGGRQADATLRSTARCRGRRTVRRGDGRKGGRAANSGWFSWTASLSRPVMP